MCADLTALASALRRAVGDRAVRTGKALIVYPRSAEQVRAVARECLAAGVPCRPGGVEPSASGVTVVTSRMRRVIEIDLPNQRAIVEPGAGSVAARAPGFVAGRITGVEACTRTGDLTWLGAGKAAEAPGYDLIGAAIGGCVPTKLVVELVHPPEAVATVLAAFRAVADAVTAIRAITAAGIAPVAMEILDAAAVVTAGHGYPLGAGAVLIAECAGPAVEVAAQVADVEVLCRGAGAFALRPDPAGREWASGQGGRAQVWRGRDALFSSARRVPSSRLVEDCVVAPARLPEVLGAVAELASSARMRVASLYLAGDQTLRTLVLYDQRRRDAARKAAGLAGAIVDLCASPRPDAEALETVELVRQAFG